MRYRLFGPTGLRVSEVFLGAIDTASAYGESESLLGEVVSRRDRFVLATKYTLSRDQQDPNAAGNHRKNLVASLEQSLRRLRTDHVDVFWVHLWDPHTPLEETMRALDDVVRAGKVLYVGISDAPAWVVSRANTLAEWRGWTPFAGVQVPYSLLNRDIEREVLPMSRELGLSVAAWGVLDHGVLAGSTNRVDESTLNQRQRTAASAVRKVAQEVGASPAQVAIAWTRSRSAGLHPIVGMSRASQVAPSLAACDLDLPADALRRLETAAPSSPGRWSTSSPSHRRARS